MKMDMDMVMNQTGYGHGHGPNRTRTRSCPLMILLVEKYYSHYLVSFNSLQYCTELAGVLTPFLTSREEEENYFFILLVAITAANVSLFH